MTMKRKCCVHAGGISFRATCHHLRQRKLRQSRPRARSSAEFRPRFRHWHVKVLLFLKRLKGHKFSDDPPYHSRRLALITLRRNARWMLFWMEQQMGKTMKTNYCSGIPEQVEDFYSAPVPAPLRNYTRINSSPVKPLARMAIKR